MEMVMKRRGCIKETRGPWIIRKRGRGGAMTTSLRRPTERERENNRERERKRRMVAARIFAGLRANGNYCLPKHADQNDVLKALCLEAGWHVDDDGTVYRKSFAVAPSNEDIDSTHQICNRLPSEYLGQETGGDDLSLKLTLSFKYM